MFWVLVDGGGGGLIILFSVHIVYCKLHLIYTKKLEMQTCLKTLLVVLGFDRWWLWCWVIVVVIDRCCDIGGLLSLPMMVVVAWHGNVVMVAVGGCYCYYCCSVIVVEKENRPGANDGHRYGKPVVLAGMGC